MALAWMRALELVLTHLLLAKAKFEDTSVVIGTVGQLITIDHPSICHFTQVSMVFTRLVSLTLSFDQRHVLTVARKRYRFCIEIHFHDMFEFKRHLF